MTDESRIVLTSRQAQRERPARSWKSFFIRWTVIVGALAAAHGAIYVLLHPDLAIDQVVVTGAKYVNSADVAALADKVLIGRYALILPKNSFFLLDAKSLTHEIIKSFPRIREIAVRKEFADTLHIRISERIFWGMLCLTATRDDTTGIMLSPALLPEATTTDATVPHRAASVESEWVPPKEIAGCAFIDETAFAYAPAPTAEGNLIRKIYTDEVNVGIGVRDMDSRLMDDVHAIAQNFEKHGQRRIARFYILADLPREIRVALAGGPILYLNRHDDYESLARYFDTVVLKEFKNRLRDVAYIDLRFGNKIFYKLRGGK